jgi:hypothetical protein
MAKMIYNKSSGEILGVHIIGLHAADLIHEASNAIAGGQTVEDIKFHVHAHPTLSEVGAGGGGGGGEGGGGQVSRAGEQQLRSCAWAPGAAGRVGTPGGGARHDQAAGRGARRKGASPAPSHAPPCPLQVLDELFKQAHVEKAPAKAATPAKQPVAA